MRRRIEVEKNRGHPQPAAGHTDEEGENESLRCCSRTAQKRAALHDLISPTRMGGKKDRLREAKLKKKGKPGGSGL